MWAERELYYLYPHHFKEQAQCNNAILECAAILGVDRESLNLRASARGLYSGAIRLVEPGIGLIDGTVAEPMPISSLWLTNPSVEFDTRGARFILVVEKEGALTITYPFCVVDTRRSNNHHFVSFRTRNILSSGRRQILEPTSLCYSHGPWLSRSCNSGSRAPGMHL